MKSFNVYKISQEHVGLTVENYLKQILQYSGRKMQKLTRQKGIFLNGKKTFLQKKLNQADTLKVLIFQDANYGVQPEQGPIELLYEDRYLMVLNKPAHQLVHPAGQTTSGTLANYLAYYLKQQNIISTIRPLHRLDRETSGCVIFAKDSHSQFILEQQLKAGTLKRTYWALVKGVVTPPTGTIDAPIGPHPTKANRRAINEQGENAITCYQVIDTFPQNTLLELNLDTGRTHQIRVHLAHLGYPIIGDSMYGVRSPGIVRQALHATAVSFKDLQHHREISIQAPLPEEFSQAIEFCRQSKPSIPEA